MATDPKNTSATPAAKQTTVAHRPAPSANTERRPAPGPGPSSSTARGATSSIPAATPIKKAAPAPSAPTNSVKAKKRTAAPARVLAPPPIFGKTLPPGFQLWKPVKFLKTTP